MNLATAASVYIIFITVEQLSGSSFREKRGSCPMYKVNTGNPLCDQEESKCNTDFDCVGDKKCCENERCGVSECVKPDAEDTIPIRHTEICPHVRGPLEGRWCRQLETKFCYKINCARCCTHKTNCNPQKELLLPPDECRTVDLRPSITYDKNSAQSGESLRFSCEPKHKNSVVQWMKVSKGKLLTIPSSMTSRTTEHLVLEMKNATVGDTGNYSCRVVHDEKTYYREISLTVSRSDTQDTCALPFQEGLCDGDMTRYYYDIKDDSCKTFKFLGCKGNDNNFVSKEQCEGRCKGKRMKCPSSGVTKYQNCLTTQQHDCRNNENCGTREACCLVGCSRKCIDPSKPWTIPVTTKSIQKTGQLTPSAPEVPCGKLVCKHFAKCQTNPSGLKECVCRKACRFDAIHPICARDQSTGRRITFPSMCFLEIRSCRLQQPFVLVRLRKCASFGSQINAPRDPCKVKQCSSYAKCVINRFSRQPQCLCPRYCRFVPKKVCGSDGRTYHNECILKVLSCKKKLYVTIDHQGPCERQ